MCHSARRSHVLCFGNLILQRFQAAAPCRAIVPFRSAGRILFFFNSHHALLDSQQALMWDSWGVALSCAHSCWPLLGQVGVRNCGVCVMHVFGRLWSSQSCSCFVPLHRLAYSFHAVIGFSVWAIVISVKLYSAVFRGGHHGSKNGAQTFCHKVGTTHRDRTVNPF